MSAVCLLSILYFKGHHEVISLEDQDEYQGGDRTPDQVDMLRERSKSYLGLHVIVGGAILGMYAVCLHLDLIMFYHT